MFIIVKVYVIILLHTVVLTHPACRQAGPHPSQEEINIGIKFLVII